MTFTLNAIEEKFRDERADFLVVSGNFVGTYVHFDFKAREIRGQGRNGANLSLPLAQVSRIDFQQGPDYRESSDECIQTVVYTYRYLDARGEVLFVLRFEEDRWDRDSPHSLSRHKPIPGRIAAQAVAAERGIAGFQEGEPSEESWFNLAWRLLRLFLPNR